MICADTSVWIASLRGIAPRLQHTLQKLLDSDAVLMPVVVRLELLAGIARQHQSRLLQDLYALPPALPTPDTWARIEGWIIDWRGPQPAYPATALTAPGRYGGHPAYARASLGATRPQASAARRRGRAAAFAGDVCLSGIPLPFAPTLPTVQTARPRRIEANASRPQFGLPDLLIAALAAERDAAVWSLDRAFADMAELGWIKLYRPPA